ncbi:putative transcription factor interactor and regulator CCHC(Zn) family [Helianthus anomalus]
MVSLLQQAIKEDILVLLQHDGSAYSIWKELEAKYCGNDDLLRNKMSLMKKEFDLFRGLRTESTKQIIERYCNLVKNMTRLGINKSKDELIEKLADALPHDVETAFNTRESSEKPSQGSSNKTGFSSFPTFDPHFSTTKSGKVLQCNIALNLENDQNYTEEVAKSHMSLLVTVLESYGGLVAGRIGNPMLTKEDYDQIDAEEMELMDIKWCMASVLRRAEKFKQITGRDDFLDANVSTLGFDKSKVTCFRCREKGHFKRECTNREAGGAQNPFGNNDYYRKAIYHQVS